MKTTNSFVFAYKEYGIGDMGLCYTPETGTWFGVDIPAIDKINIHCPYNPDTKLIIIEEDDYVMYNGFELKVVDITGSGGGLTVSLQEGENDPLIIVEDKESLMGMKLII